MRVAPISIAVENRSAVLIKEIRSAMAEYVSNERCASISIVPSEPLKGLVLGELEPLTLEALRRAEIIRNVHEAAIGVSFVTGHVSIRPKVPSLRRSYETVAIVAVAKEGAIGVRFPDNTIPEDLVDSLDMQMKRVGARLERAMVEAADEEVFQIGRFVVNTLASFTYASEGEAWHWVN